MALTNSSKEIGLATAGSGPKPVVARRRSTARNWPSRFLNLKKRIRKGSGDDSISSVKRLVGQKTGHQTGYAGIRLPLSRIHQKNGIVCPASRYPVGVGRVRHKALNGGGCPLSNSQPMRIQFLAPFWAVLLCA